nr:LysR family transcriptional regulator [uncultured Acidocella sp.]
MPPAPDVSRPLNDRALRYFLAVVRLGSIRAAAEALHVAPSAISRQIAELEASCGALLLERLPRGVVATEAGRLVAEHAQRQQDEATALTDRLRQLRGLQQGIVQICCGAGFLPDLMENALAGFTRAFPGISYRIVLGTTDAITAAVAAGETDIGLAYNPTAHADVRTVVKAHQPLRAILPPGHEMTGHRKPVSLRSFAYEATALLPADHGIRQLIGRAEANGGFRLIARLESASFEAHRQFVTAGMGVAFLPEFVVFPELRDRLVTALPLSDPLLAEAMVHLQVRVARRLPAATETLLHWLGERLLALHPAPSLP